MSKRQKWIRQHRLRDAGLNTHPGTNRTHPGGRIATFTLETPTNLLIAVRALWRALFMDRLTK